MENSQTRERIQRTLGVGILMGGVGGLGVYHYVYKGTEGKEESQDNLVTHQTGKENMAFMEIANLI